MGVITSCVPTVRQDLAYQTVLPGKRHVAVGKETGLTNRIERKI